MSVKTFRNLGIIFLLLPFIIYLLPDPFHSRSNSLFFFDLGPLALFKIYFIFFSFAVSLIFFLLAIIIYLLSGKERIKKDLLTTGSQRQLFQKLVLGFILLILGFVLKKNQYYLSGFALLIIGLFLFLPPLVQLLFNYLRYSKGRK